MEDVDYRDQALKQILIGLSSNFDTNTLQLIENQVILTLDKYELSERQTSIVPIEKTNEEFIRLFASCKYIEGKSKSTIKAYIAQMQRFCKEIQLPLNTITTSNIRYYIAKLKSINNCSDRYLENVRAYLSSFFMWMYEENYIDDNPMKSVKPIKFKNVVKKAFTDIELDKLRSACTNIRDRALIEVLATSGVRVNELINLKISDINFSDNSIYIREGKGNKERITYISNIAAEYLQQYLNTRSEKSEMLFTAAKHEQISSSGVRHILHKIGRNAGVQDVHPHKFRRQFATTAIKRGMGIQDVKILMGHAEIGTTTTYLDITSNDVINSYKRYIN